MVVCDVTSENKEVIKQLEDAHVSVQHRSRTKKDSSDEVLLKAADEKSMLSKNIIYRSTLGVEAADEEGGGHKCSSWQDCSHLRWIPVEFILKH